MDAKDVGEVSRLYIDLRISIQTAGLAFVGTGLCSYRVRCVDGTEMDMGWVHPWVGLGWVGSHFPAHMMGWVGLKEKYCGIVAEYCKTHTFHCH